MAIHKIKHALIPARHIHDAKGVETADQRTVYHVRSVAGDPSFVATWAKHRSGQIYFSNVGTPYVILVPTNLTAIDPTTIASGIGMDATENTDGTIDQGGDDDSIFYRIGFSLVLSQGDAVAQEVAVTAEGRTHTNDFPTALTLKATLPQNYKHTFSGVFYQWAVAFPFTTQFRIVSPVGDISIYGLVLNVESIAGPSGLL